VQIKCVGKLVLLSGKHEKAACGTRKINERTVDSPRRGEWEADCP